MGGHLLDVRDLSVEFRTGRAPVRAVRGVSWHLDRGETLAILGESGSGKSVSAQAVMGILDSPPARVTSGAVLHEGRDLLTLPADERRAVRGARIAMVFQDALSALNPVLTVGAQIAEMFRAHRGTSKREALARAGDLLDRVRIPNARARLHDFPHQFSGGMRQRVMIAMALALEPAVIIADEPTTALDVTVQAQIMDLLRDVRREHGTGIVLITHDLGVVAETADRVAVMYAGRIVETGAITDVFARPAHPYTVGLMGSVARVDVVGGRLTAIGGAPPSLARIPPGCAFAPRCPRARDRCALEEPALREVAPGRRSACHFGEGVLRG